MSSLRRNKIELPSTSADSIEAWGDWKEVVVVAVVVKVAVVVARGEWGEEEFIEEGEGVAAMAVEEREAKALTKEEMVGMTISGMMEVGGEI